MGTSWTWEDLFKEVKLKAICSGGKGGQHVNKVATRIELRFSLNDSDVLSEEEKDKIRTKLENRLSQLAELVLWADDERSQHRNRELALGRFRMLIEQALAEEKERKETKPPPGIKEERLKYKKYQSEKKEQRKKDFFKDYE